jgi:hypothetical protein
MWQAKPRLQYSSDRSSRVHYNDDAGAKRKFFQPNQYMLSAKLKKNHFTLVFFALAF